MNGTRWIRRWGIALLVVMFELPALAQKNGFGFYGPLSISAGFDDAYQSSTASSAAPLIFVSAGMGYVKRQAGKPSFAALYTPEAQVLLRGSNGIRLNNAVALAYDQPFGPRSGLDVGYAFLDTTDPIRALSSSVFAQPRSSYRESSLAGTVYRIMSRRTSIAGRFDHTIANMASFRQSTVDLNQSAVAGTVSVTRRLTERQRLSGSYSLLRFSPYSLDNVGTAFNFLPSVPTIRGGFSRYAMMLAASTASHSSAPAGLVAGTRFFATTPDGDTPSLPPPGVIDPGLEIPTISSLDTFSHPFHAFIGTYSNALRPDLVVDVAGGAMKDTQIDGETSWLFRLQVRKRISRIWLATEIEHYPSRFTPLPIQGVSRNDRIAPEDASWSTFSILGFRLDGMINPATTVSVVTTYSRGSAGFLNNATALLLIGGRVTYWFNDRVGSFIATDFFGNSFSENISAGPNRQRYFGGLQFVMEPRIH